MFVGPPTGVGGQKHPGVAQEVGGGQVSNTGNARERSKPLTGFFLAVIAATLVVTLPLDRRIRSTPPVRGEILGPARLFGPPRFPQNGQSTPQALLVPSVKLQPSILARGRKARETIPLSFEVNEGQTDSPVKFLARGRGFCLFLTSEGAKLRLRRPGASQEDAAAPRDTASASRAAPATAVVGLRLAGANPAPRAEGLDELPGKSNYILGQDPAKWRTNIPQYARVKYRDVYPGVDLVFYGSQGRLEYDFLVAPGAEASRIQLQLEGADAARIDEKGDLVVKAGDAEVRQLQPIAYQDWGGSRHFLSGRYVLRGPREVGFEVSGYRADKMLVIDPVLAYSSFLGGSGLDIGHAIAVDAGNNVYLTGETASTNFPTQNPEQPANAGGSDVFVTKLNPTGSVILFSTYLGGSANENDFRSGVESSGIAVDAAGNVYLTGRTSSMDFPVVNALLPSYRGGDYDAFVSKLSADGRTLLYSTYLGGAANDSGNGIAVDSAGNVYVTGGTRSDTDFPISPGAFQRFPNGQLEAFVTKIDTTQQGAASLIYSTFLGGTGIDRGTAIAVDSAGKAYVTGRTESPDFPTRNAFQATYGGAADAFVTVVNPSGTDIVYSTYLGGSGLDVGNGIALDIAGNVYITGETASPNFPTMNGYQTAIGGSSDAFVAQLDPTGAVLVYATYLGGSGLDRGTGIALDSTGKISMTGETSSGNFPTVNAFQGAPGGGKDAFVARLDPSQQGAASLLYSSYLGGSADDVAFGIAVNSAGDAWVIGQTAPGANFPTVNAVQATYGGGTLDAFVARVSNASATPDYGVSATPTSLTVTPGGTASYTVTVAPVGGFTGNVDLSVGGLPLNTMASFNPPTVVIGDATPQTSALTVTTSMSTPLGTNPLSIIGTSGALQHTASVTLVITSGTGTADLSITKTAAPSPVEVRNSLTYSANVINLGPAVATGVQVTDMLPTVTFVSATATQGTCSGTSTVICNIGTLAVGAGAAVTIVVTPQAIGSISNTATVTANEPDPNPNNNSATAVTTVEASCPAPGPCMLDPNLSVTTVVSGLTEPTGIAFLGPDDFLVLEKSTGQVKRVVGGVVQGVVLDLAVNSASERGLLGIALHPDFANNGFVYLYWTCRGAAAAPDCDSMFGGDTSDLAQVPLLGNRVDRFIWDGATLTFDQNLIRLHAYQQDADANGVFNQPLRGNHNGGKIVFGPDGKLYILIGDNGRRGWMQNITTGVLPNGMDDQFGGPEPDNAHFTGVIIRLNDDGSTPPDNPFFDVGAQMGGEVGANIQKIFAYGVRNSFGMTFDPLTGNLWTEENGDDSFDEINLVSAGFNGGWVQIMGPSGRIADYKGIETSPRYFGLQQVRWPPTRIANTPDEAMASLFMLPGAQYTEPLFSWKYAVAPSPIGFVNGPGLGPQYQGDLIVGAARTFLAGGYLFDFKLTTDRSDLDLSADPRLADRVADNVDKFDLTESESLLIGRDFGITTDIQTAPNGNLWVVSLTNGAVYEIFANTPSAQQPSTRAGGHGKPN
jgi:uncharacterized repeat protein (TIGR01451 family)